MDPVLFVGGSFDVAGVTPVKGLAKWDGQLWTSISGGLNHWVYALALSKTAPGTDSVIYAGGSFTGAGGATANRIARWSNGQWLAVGNGFNNTVYSLLHVNDALEEGSTLYAGGEFTKSGATSISRIAQWNGQQWLPLGTGVNNAVHAMAIYDDGSGSALYAGGAFTAAGGAPASRIARWDGESWTPLGGGVNNIVYALTVFDDGTGQALYAGGNFTSADGVAVSRVARWDGQQWSAVGHGLNGSVRALTPFYDSSRSTAVLYAAGGFNASFGAQMRRVARWDTEQWGPVGDGQWQPVSSYVNAIAVQQNSCGLEPTVYVGGNFISAKGVPASHAARWDGYQWSALGAGLSSHVRALAFDEGNLIVGGFFEHMESKDSYMARWGCDQSNPPIDARFDIRPGSCPNPMNTNANGVIPAAILGTAEFDVSTIDVTSLVISRADGVGGCASPLNGPPGPGIKIEDVGTPFTDPDPCDCHDLGGDGIDDLTLKFNIPELVAALELADLPAGTSAQLQITGQLLDGTPFAGTDCIIIIGQGNQTGGNQPATGSDPGDGVLGDLTADGEVGVADLLILLWAWGPCADSDNCPADLDGDGAVGIGDLLMLLANWG